MDAIEDFVEQLRRYKGCETVFNPYLNDGVANNLVLYLRTMLGIRGCRILLVGEAPGYNGCAITGIPFTSGQVFQNVPHPLLLQLKNSLVLSRLESEKTASIVWQYLSTKEVTPLFWNSFPFHPHLTGNPNSNRRPTEAEIIFGSKYLVALNEIFKPVQIAGIGWAGVRCAQKSFSLPCIKYIRHPSFGGKASFVKGMEEMIQTHAF